MLCEVEEIKEHYIIWEKMVEHEAGKGCRRLYPYSIMQGVFKYLEVWT